MKNNKSFTLVETLAVITIIGIFSGFLILRFQESNYEAELSRAKAFSLSVLMSLPVETVSGWKFDGPTTAGSSATLDDVKDTWGANDGTVYGTPVVKDGNDCISGKCMAFDGTDDYIDCGNGDNLNIVNSITISVWAKPISSSVGQIVGKGTDGSTGYWIFLNTASQGWRAKFEANSQIELLATGGADLNKWYYLVASYDNIAGGKLYINGILKHSLSANGNIVSPSARNFLIGAHATGDWYKFNGLIDNVSIFNKALEVSQINQIYLSGLDSLYLSNQIPKEEYNQRLSELKMNLTKHE